MHPYIYEEKIYLLQLSYTGSFGIESVVIDILIFFISILIGQLLGLHFYKYSKGLSASILIILFLIIFIAYCIFTINPPRLPLFLDSVTNTYGIYKN